MARIGRISESQLQKLALLRVGHDPDYDKVEIEHVEVESVGPGPVYSVILHPKNYFEPERKSVHFDRLYLDEIQYLHDEGVLKLEK